MPRTQKQKSKTSRSSSKTTTKRTKPHKRRPLTHPLHISLAAVACIAAVAGFLLVGIFGELRNGKAADCTVSATLVNPCRPWVGSTSGGYTQVASDINSQFNYAQKRLNNPNVLTNASLAVTLSKKLDMAHVYHPQGTNLFSGSVKNVLNNGDFAQVFVNWKPMPANYKWKDADGSNASVNSYIKTGAQAVKTLGSRKIFLTVWHEPENDVSVGNCASNASGASMGSPAEYVKMWQNVRNIFNQEGVGNVVWTMNYMGFSKWNCLIPQLWPGNDLVDWIVWDPYAGNTETFGGSLQLYNYLSQNSDSSHNYNSKPWGLAEHGYYNVSGNSTESGAVSYWNQAKSAIQNNTYPKLKMYLVFDTTVNGTTQVGMTFTGQPSVTEQTAFNDFVNTVLALQGSSGGTAPPPATPPPPPPPATDNTPPTVTITSPANSSTQKGTITIAGTASDNTGVTSVTLRMDDKYVATDESTPYSFNLDTTKYSEGQHTLVLRAWDAVGNMGQSGTLTIAINNTAGDQTGTTPPPPEDVVIDVNTPSSPSKPIQASGSIIVTPEVPGNAVQVYVDGELQSNNVIETSKLTDGTHKIKIVEDGKVSEKHIRVDNPLPLAMVNHVRANPGPYGGGVIIVILLAFLGGKFYLSRGFSGGEAKLRKLQQTIGISKR